MTKATPFAPRLVFPLPARSTFARPELNTFVSGSQRVQVLRIAARHSLTTFSSVRSLPQMHEI